MAAGDGPQNRGMHPIRHPRIGRDGGFTLIELMIAVAIVAILAAVALPSFFDSLRKSRRSEAFNAIAAVQQAQERWRGGHTAYNTNLTASPADGGLGLSALTPKGLYAIAIEDATADGYTVSAIAVAGTSQASDKPCLKLAARIRRAQVLYAGCQSCSLADADFSESNACWAR